MKKKMTREQEKAMFAKQAASTQYRRDYTEETTASTKTQKRKVTLSLAELKTNILNWAEDEAHDSYGRNRTAVAIDDNSAEIQNAKSAEAIKALVPARVYSWQVRDMIADKWDTDADEVKLRQYDIHWDK